ncbi:hypothetical protein DFH08DRAFT_814770 [Mycena albidolilacea]|uniref:Uncharacterized protein n=1 Tax=Mycena albidolilacea TaxID=1033008 RepID=A0AAD7EJT3_9AGAR|nr:hypothetical protein DFH08DRAFT_814770 [Mycena albidolilacea]
MAMARERIECYTSLFFCQMEHATLFFYQLEDRRAWIVGSIALAVLSFSCDFGVPYNLNVISSALMVDTWIACMRDQLGYTLRRCPSGPFYAKLALGQLVFTHSKIENRTITIMISQSVEIFELFLRVRMRLMSNAITAQELVSTYVDLTSNFQGVCAYTPAFMRPLDVTFTVPDSPFPDVITLLDDTETLDWEIFVAILTALTVVKRSCDGNVHRNMASLSDPNWPAALHSKHQLLDFLYSKAIPSLVTDIFNVEFRLGIYGSYASDETACTNDKGTRYSTFIFGRVMTTVGPKPTFKVDGGSMGDTSLHLAFMNQFNIDVHPCTDSDRQDGSGGTWIEIDVGGIPLFRDGPEGLVETVASRASEVRLTIGDWVLVRASLHRVDDRCGYKIRHFYVNADAIRILDLDSDVVESADGENLSDGSLGRTLSQLGCTADPAVVASTDDETLSDESLGVGSPGDGSFGGVPVRTPDQLGGLSTVQVVESSGADELEEQEMSAPVPENLSEETHPRAGPSAAENGGVSTIGLRRNRSTSIDGSKWESLDLDHAPSTPLRKRRRTARISTGGRAPPSVKKLELVKMGILGIIRSLALYSTDQKKEPRLKSGRYDRQTISRLSKCKCRNRRLQNIVQAATMNPGAVAAIKPDPYSSDGPGVNYIVTRNLVVDVEAYEQGRIDKQMLLSRREIKMGESKDLVQRRHGYAKCQKLYRHDWKAMYTTPERKLTEHLVQEKSCSARRARTDTLTLQLRLLPLNHPPVAPRECENFNLDV